MEESRGISLKIAVKLLNACNSYDVKLASKLLQEHDINLNAQVFDTSNDESEFDKNNDFLLNWACLKNSEELVQFLLLSGANPNIRDDINKSDFKKYPLFSSLKQNISTKICKMLLVFGADLLFENRNNCSIISFAFHNSTEEKLMTALKSGAKTYRFEKF